MKKNFLNILYKTKPCKTDPRTKCISNCNNFREKKRGIGIKKT